MRKQRIQEGEEETESVYQRVNKREKTIGTLETVIKKHHVKTESELLRLWRSKEIDAITKDNLWKAITSPQFTSMFNTARNLVKTEAMDVPFTEMMEYAKRKHHRNVHTQVESRQLMQRLLKAQDVEPKKFLVDLYNILCKKLSKVNVFMMEGERNSGKSMIILAVSRCFSEVADVNLKTENQFAWGDAIDKCLMKLEEPNITPDHVELCKKIFEGMDEVEVSVKNRGNGHLNRTPILSSSNYPCWRMSTHAEGPLKTRMIRYTGWKTQLWLKEYEKQINPLIFANAFLHIHECEYDAAVSELIGFEKRNVRRRSNLPTAWTRAMMSGLRTLRRR